MKKRTVALLAALVLLLGCAIGGTVAWLMDETKPVVNTFTAGDINITLTESDSDNTPNENSYKMVPGNTIKKDPYVGVLAGSEACYLFVKIEESENFDNYLTYTIAKGWEHFQPEDKGVTILVKEVEASDQHQKFAVLEDDAVKVREDVTKAQMEAIKEKDQPTLTFTAYAVQQANVADAEKAWKLAAEIE